MRLESVLFSRVNCYFVYRKRIVTEGSSKFQTRDLWSRQSLKGMNNFAFFARKHLQDAFPVPYGNLEYKIEKVNGHFGLEWSKLLLKMGVCYVTHGFLDSLGSICPRIRVELELQLTVSRNGSIYKKKMPGSDTYFFE